MSEDDTLMDRFDRNARRFRARDGIVAVFLCALVLILIQGGSVKHQGQQLGGDVQGKVVRAVGGPSSWIAARLPLHDAADRITAPLSPDDKLTNAGSFAVAAGPAGRVGQVPPVTPDAFSAAQLGARPPAKRSLKTVLVTGDSLSMPLDQEIARRLAPKGIKVTRDPHQGTGISKTALVDWGKLSTQQAEKVHPDAVVVFIGANEGFPMTDPANRQASCCGADWASVYANRVRNMMNTYRRNGQTHIYWLTVPTPRGAARAKIGKVVNAAVQVAAEPWRSQVSVLDTIPIFTPGGKYRDSMTVDGRDQLVRRDDGIHLNDLGASLMADVVVRDLGADFTF
jgi:lysophospholipase L1-like esterase